MATKIGFIDLLIKYKHISPSEADIAREYAANNECTEAHALIINGIMEKSRVARAVSEYYKLKVISDVDFDKFDKDLMRRFDQEKLFSLKMLPTSLSEDNNITILIVDPKLKVQIEGYVRECVPEAIEVHFMLLMEQVFINWVNENKINSDLNKIDDIMENIEVVDAEDNAATPYELSSDDNAQIVALVNAIFIEAFTRGASDIHIEPMPDDIRVRYRIDGMLVEGRHYPQSLGPQIVNRIKVMGKMNVNDTKRTQGGNLSLAYAGQKFGIRLSVLPTYIGEKITARLLDAKGKKYSLDSLELNSDTLSKLENVIERPNGIILVVGATGSGKSTTLFTVLNKLNTIDQCLITVEDPVEFKVPGVTQIAVNAAQGLTFAMAFRECLRQDPDVIMVGEIRDSETAGIATQASMSGHLVLSTLHANNSCSAVARMGTMGVRAEDLSNSLAAVMSQCLVRRLCPDCKEKYTMQEDHPFKGIFDEYESRILEINEGKADRLIKKLEDHNRKAKILHKSIKEIPNRDALVEQYNKEDNIGQKIFYKAHKGGCKSCGHSGYKGRVVLMEFLEITPEIRREIQNNSPVQDIEKIALEQGLLEMRYVGVQKAVLGVTSFEELHETIHFDNL